MSARGHLSNNSEIVTDHCVIAASVVHRPCKARYGRYFLQAIAVARDELGSHNGKEIHPTLRPDELFYLVNETGGLTLRAQVTVLGSLVVAVRAERESPFLDGIPQAGQPRPEVAEVLDLGLSSE